MPDDMGINSNYNSYYVHNSEGYSRAVEEIAAEEREDSAEAQIEKDQIEKTLSEEELLKLQEFNRDRERQILEEIKAKELEREIQLAEISEYERDSEEDPPGTKLDLLA